MLIFWLFMAYRAFQRRDISMAAVLTLVGVVLTVYRLKTLRRVASDAATAQSSGQKSQ
jgi:ABC-type Fe3+-siderophore transport system permease subunit